MMHPKYTLHQSSAGDYYFTLTDRKGEILATSKTFAKKSQAREAIRAVKKSASAGTDDISRKSSQPAHISPMKNINAPAAYEDEFFHPDDDIAPEILDAFDKISYAATILLVILIMTAAVSWIATL